MRALNPARDVLPMVRRELDVLHLLRKLRYEPQSSPLHLALADAYSEGGAMVEAVEATRAAAALGPGDPAVLLKLATLEENLELVDGAFETYRALARLSPADGRIARKVEEFEVLARDRAARQRWLNSSEIVLSRKGKDDGHPESCTRASQTWSTVPFEGRIDARDLARAAALFEQAVEAKRDHMHAYADAARIHEALGDYGRAASLWRRGLEVAPGDRGAERERLRLELLARLAGEGPAAVRDAEALAEAGRLYGASGETEKAMELLRRAVAADPGRAEAWRDLAASCVDAGRYPEAIQALQEALRHSPAPPDVDAMREALDRLKERVVASRPRPSA